MFIWLLHSVPENSVKWVIMQFDLIRRFIKQLKQSAHSFVLNNFRQVYYAHR